MTSRDLKEGDLFRFVFSGNEYRVKEINFGEVTFFGPIGVGIEEFGFTEDDEVTEPLVELCKHIEVISDDE